MYSTGNISICTTGSVVYYIIAAQYHSHDSTQYTGHGCRILLPSISQTKTLPVYAKFKAQLKSKLTHSLALPLKV